MSDDKDAVEVPRFQLKAWLDEIKRLQADAWKARTDRPTPP